MAFGSNGKMLNKTTTKISVLKPILLSPCQPTSGSTLMISVANVIGDHAMEGYPKEVLTIPVAQGTIFMKIPIKIGAIKAHALINTGAQCSILSSGLVKRALDKQSLQLLICGKIKVADGTIVNAHSPVVVTMESAFREHMIKCIILDNDSNDQCIISTDFLMHPDIHMILNFKDNYVEIQDVKLPLKVMASVGSQTEFFLKDAKDNVLEEIPEEERVSFYDDKSDTFSQSEEIEAQQAV
uniref:Peptidase A2 domain-containing protein n=1 Tax=Romanomermis culicivorax TaxID=13658 RepID=A0A915L2R9_ROMCU